MIFDAGETRAKRVQKHAQKRAPTTRAKRVQNTCKNACRTRIERAQQAGRTRENPRRLRRLGFSLVLLG